MCMCMCFIYRFVSCLIFAISFAASSRNIHLSMNVCVYFMKRRRRQKKNHYIKSHRAWSVVTTIITLLYFSTLLHKSITDMCLRSRAYLLFAPNKFILFVKHKCKKNNSNNSTSHSSSIVQASADANAYVHFLLVVLAASKQ